MQVLKRFGAMVRHFFAHKRSDAERDRLESRLEYAFPVHGGARRHPDSTDQDPRLMQARAAGALRS